MTIPTAKESRALLAEYDRLRVRSTLADHLHAALDREEDTKGRLVDAQNVRDAMRAAFMAAGERAEKAEAERDAAQAEVEKLRSEKQAAENMSTVRAIEIVMARCKMHQEVQRVMRVQLHNARGALETGPGA